MLKWTHLPDFPLKNVHITLGLMMSKEITLGHHRKESCPIWVRREKDLFYFSNLRWVWGVWKLVPSFISQESPEHDHPREALQVYPVELLENTKICAGNLEAWVNTTAGRLVPSLKIHSFSGFHSERSLWWESSVISLGVGFDYSV